MTTPHIHAALMAEYAKDAAETNTPWDRWEFSYPSLGRWVELLEHPEWDPRKLYRRKRTPLCQVEGRDVFPGDKLWHVEQGWLTAIKMDGSNLVCTMEDGDTWRPLFSYLSWTEPARTKTVYQWAFLGSGGRWMIRTTFYATEEELRSYLPVKTEVRRLDYTALEVPA